MAHEDGFRDAGQRVVDFYPDGIPQLMSDRLEETLDEGLADGLSGGAIRERLADERACQFRDDPAFRERVRREMERSGVNTPIATTLSSGADDRHGWDAVIRDLGRWRTYLDAADWLSLALTPGDIADDGVTVLLEMQNTTALGGPAEFKSGRHLDRLERLFDFGIRAVQLTYNRRNLVGDGCTERTDAGLSRAGVEVVEKLDSLGVVVDLSHCGPATTLDAIDVAGSPPAYTHTSCGAVYDYPRAKSDEELAAIADAGGYVGIVGIPFFIGGSRDVEAMVDHVDHAVDVVGVDRVGVGTDWTISWTAGLPEPLQERMAYVYERENLGDEHEFAFGESLPPMERYGDWGAIPDALEARGYGDGEIRGICGGNFVEYFERVVG